MQMYFDWDVFWQVIKDGAYWAIPTIIVIEMLRFAYNRHLKSKKNEKSQNFNADDY